MGIFDKLLKKKTTEDKAKDNKAEKKAAVKEKAVKTDAKQYTSLKPKGETAVTAEPAKTTVTKEQIAKKPIKKDNSNLAYRILIKPLITEKATNLVSLNKYAFQVAKSANKAEIKRAIKTLYGYDPISINIINERGNKVTYGRIKGKKSSWKKAIITLKPGEKLEIYEGV